MIVTRSNEILVRDTGKPWLPNRIIQAAGVAALRFSCRICEGMVGSDGFGVESGKKTFSYHPPLGIG